MNFLVVGKDFPPNIGGISTYTKELSTALAKSCQVMVLASGAFNIKDFDRRCPFKIVRTPPFPFFRFMLFFLYLPWLLKRFHIDAVIHTVWPTALVSYFWHRLIPIPYFVSVHASEILDDTTSLRRRLKGYFKRLRIAALRKATGIFPVSHYSKTFALAMGIEEKHVHVITNGVDPERFKPVSHHEETDEKRKILTVARLDLHKGHDRVLEALFLLKKQGCMPSYLIVGEGDQEMRLRRLVKEFGLDNQVTFTGYKPEDQLPDIYSEADIFVMASREIPGRLDLIEGFGISFLEASASGLPVVAGRSGGVADAVMDGITGILVDPDNPEDIASALKLLISDNKLAAQMGSEGRKWAETQMSWEHVADRLLNTIGMLMEK